MAAMMNPAVHMLLPGSELARLTPRPRESIKRFVARAGWAINAWPTICMRVRGGTSAPVMRAEWRERIRKGDTIVFVSRPRGGSASTRNLIGLLGMVALSALAPGLGTAAGAALFGAGTAAAGVAAAVVTAGIAIGGGLALQTLLRSAPGGQSEASGDPIYSWGRQLNSARPLQTIPVAYGRTRRALDYAAAPWDSFENQDQYRHVVLSLGEGRHAVEQMLIDDTVLWSATAWPENGGVNPEFTGVSIGFHEAGETITDFPLNVQTSAEVSGQELQYPGWTGGFVVNSAGTTTTRLALDILMPSGCYALNSEGKMIARGTGVAAEYCLVDDEGEEAGVWTAIPWTPVLVAIPNPLRFTITADVPVGRYKVRARRINAKLNDPKVADQINWYGLRAFIAGPQSFPVPVATMRLKATNQLSQESLSRMSVISTRILPVWTGTAWEDQPTRRPAWAALDLATNATFGGGRSLAKVDLQAFVDLAAVNEARDETFDYEFADGMGCLDALDTILAPAYARTRWLGDLLSVFREGWSPLPDMMLTDNEIVRDSLSRKYELMPSTGPDGVVLEYIDETTWKIATVTAPRGASPLRPERRRVAGISKRTHAQLVCDRLWRSLNKRRIRVRFATEHDGRLLSLGSSIAVQTHLARGWGQGGEVVARRGNRLRLSPPPTWGEGDHYIKVRTRTGRQWGIVKCARGDDDGTAELDAADLAAVEIGQGPLDAALARADGAAGASFALGGGTAWQARCVVIGGVPRGEQVALETWLDDPSIYDDDLTEVPPLPTSPSPANPAGRPDEVKGLAARIVGNEIPRRLEATWWPAAGAVSYIAAISFDAGASWTPLPEVREPSFSVTVFPQNLLVRVAGVNAAGRPGLYTVQAVAAPVELSADNVPIRLENLRGDSYASLVKMRTDIDSARAEIKALALDVAAGFGAQVLQTSVAVRTAKAAAVAVNRLSASIETIGGQVTALAEAVTAVSANVGDVAGEGLWKMEVRAVEGGDVTTRLVIMMRATHDDEWVEVGTSWEAGFVGGDPFARIANYAAQFTIVDPFNEDRLPLFVADVGTSTVYMPSAWIKSLDVSNFNLDATQLKITSSPPRIRMSS